MIDGGAFIFVVGAPFFISLCYNLVALIMCLFPFAPGSLSTFIERVRSVFLSGPLQLYVTSSPLWARALHSFSRKGGAQRSGEVAGE